MSPTLDRRSTTPVGRVHTIRSGNKPGPWGLLSSLRQICSRSCGKSAPRQGDRTATAQFEPRFRVLSSNGTTPQVDRVTHTRAFADFLQLRAIGREETAHQSIPAELLELDPPALGATAQPLENPGQLRRDRSLSLAKNAAGVVDQFESPRNHRRPPRKFPRVPRVGSRSTPGGYGDRQVKDYPPILPGLSRPAQ